MENTASINEDVCNLIYEVEFFLINHLPPTSPTIIMDNHQLANLINGEFID